MNFLAFDLYEHNQKAYESVLFLLSKKGKAAVIHPTGTGKSFIGFQLCADHPDQKICWLSPSKYIFQTQLENLAAASHGWQPDNVVFLTYARLMNMTDEEIGQIRPDYIILDEFHRCGALAWGQGVARLLARYENVPLLGLSATAIRYLDNQRDMSDELFDGHIASKMTLGEAIVRGILNPPVYVQALYSYRDDLDRYAGRIKKLQNRKRKEEAEKILDQLKRALNQAEGLDQLFDKYMADRRGKYIVFCANYEAMTEAIGKAGEWFQKVDQSPRIYSLYTEDPGASESFRAFKADENRDHLRLLFCIDALNEGVHVENVSGVILLRPTISPVVYKQQIGRALSASKQTRPVVFDLVNNIEGLYSIDAVREEMAQALLCMRREDGQSLVVNDRFQVLGRMENCLRLFDQLEGTLTADWETMYREAEKYYKTYGNLIPPLAYETDKGYALGRWIFTQRLNRQKGEPSLTEEGIARLDAIGMSWDSAEDRSWKNFYEAASKYYEENGNLDIPAEYETDEGLKLGRIYRGIRRKYTEGRLSEERKTQLEEIGIQWNSVLARKWMRYYQLAKAYYEERGDLNIPHDYEAEGFKVGIWISSQRESYRLCRLSPQQISLLEAVGMSWDRFESKWEQGFDCCKKYVEDHGDINQVPRDYEYKGIRLSVWLHAQRYSKKTGKLTADRAARLEALGLAWDKGQAFWNRGYAHALAYRKAHGSLRMPASYECEDGFKLRSWLNNQHTRLKSGKLTAEQVKKLAVLGVSR